MKRKITVVLILALLISCFTLGESAIVNAYAEDAMVTAAPTSSEQSLSGVTPKVKYLKSTKKKQVTIKYNKISGVNYYHIIISTDKFGRRGCQEIKTTKTSYTIKKLKSKKKYYIKVRGCVGDMNETLVVDATRFSKLKSIKVK